MNRPVIFVVTFLAVWLDANAWCFPFREGDTFNLCRIEQKTLRCFAVKSDGFCYDVHDNFNIGFTNGGNECWAYPRHGCSHFTPNIKFPVDGTLRKLPFAIRAVYCPCHWLM